MKCPCCGKEILDNSRFCGFCGEHIPEPYEVQGFQTKNESGQDYFNIEADNDSIRNDAQNATSEVKTEISSALPDPNSDTDADLPFNFDAEYSLNEHEKYFDLGEDSSFAHCSGNKPCRVNKVKSNKKWLIIGGAIVLLCTIILIQSISNRLSNISDYEIETATSTVDSGTCGVTLTWTLSADGTLTISGTGAMRNYDFYAGGNVAPWSKQEKSIKSIVIEDGITSIGDASFSGCENMTSISIPKSVTSIGDSAFFDCYSLSSIIIPSGVTSIGDGAFERCGLTSIIIPSAVTNIGKYTFERCWYLTSVSIPSSVTNIGEAAFERCGYLRSINIPSSVTSIGERAFCRCISLASVTIPDSVTSIGNTAFCECSSLTSVEIQEGVTSIGDYAFSNCSSLTSVTVPSSVTSIGNDTFANCTSLMDVYYSGTEAQRGNISISIGNESLINATWHCKSAPVANGQFGDNLTSTPEISGVDILNAIGADITYPNDSDYLKTCLYKKIYAELGSCYGLSSLDNGTRLKIYNGTEAVVIAEHSFFENDKNRNMTYSCCIIKNNGKQIARWINNDYLVENVADYTPFHVEYS